MMIMLVGRLSDTCLYWASISSAANLASLNLLISTTVQLIRFSVILIQERFTHTGSFFLLKKAVSKLVTSSPEAITSKNL